MNDNYQYIKCWEVKEDGTRDLTKPMIWRLSPSMFRKLMDLSKENERNSK